MSGYVDNEIVFAKRQQYEDAVRFLLQQIVDCVTDGDDFEFEKFPEYLDPLGIDFEEFCQP